MLYDCPSSAVAAMTTARLLPLHRAAGVTRALRFQRSTPVPGISSCPSAARWISSQKWSSSAAATPETPASIIDGKLISKQVKDEVAAEIAKMKDAIGVVPVVPGLLCDVEQICM